MRKSSMRKKPELIERQMPLIPPEDLNTQQLSQSFGNLNSERKYKREPNKLASVKELQH